MRRSPRDRATVRRRSFIAAVALAAGVVGCLSCFRGPALSRAERALVGEWGCPDDDPRATWMTRAGTPMRRPWIIQEFAGDRSYRRWVAPAVDSGDRSPLARGRWRVVAGRLRLEDDPPGMGSSLRAIGIRIAGATGLPLGTPPLGARADLPYRLAGADDLEFPPSEGDRDPRTYKWKRLPSTPR